MTKSIHGKGQSTAMESQEFSSFLVNTTPSRGEGTRPLKRATTSPTPHSVTCGLWEQHVLPVFQEFPKPITAVSRWDLPEILCQFLVVPPLLLEACGSRIDDCPGYAHGVKEEGCPSIEAEVQGPTRALLGFTLTTQPDLQGGRTCAPHTVNLSGLTKVHPPQSVKWVCTSRGCDLLTMTSPSYPSGPPGL